MPIKKCEKCNGVFYVRPAHLSKGWGKYCSAKCQHESARSGSTVKCHICGNETYKTLLQVARSKSKKFFCGKSCQTKWRNKEFSGEKSLLWKNGQTTYRDIMLKKSVPRKCVLCQEKDFRVLAVHHIDQNRKNYKVENLAWLCHNCHHLVHSDLIISDEFKRLIRNKQSKK